MATTIKNKSDYIVRINQSLNLIRPYLQADGGDVELIELTDDFVVRVKLQGSCSTCKMKMQTLKLGIENTLKRSVPEIKYVEEVE